MTTTEPEPADATDRDDPDATAPASDDREAVDATAGDDRDADDREDAHLEDVEPGAGCTEIWEHLSETRDD